eukprot:4518354-Prymnesium_polylepis.1
MSSNHAVADSSDSPPPPPTVSPPRGWPESFNLPELQQYVEGELRGQRVRLIGRPGAGDEAKIHRLKAKT